MLCTSPIANGPELASGAVIAAPGETAIRRYVSPTGNDTTGYGTKTAPYLTVGRALKDYPRLGFREPNSGFCVLLEAGGTYAENLAMSFDAAAAPDDSIFDLCPITISVDPESANAGLVNDARWTYDVGGPVTATAATTEFGRNVYTFAAATGTEDQHMCQQVRVWRAGVEIYRGQVAAERNTAKQVVIQGNGALPAPAIGDVVYFCKPSCVISGSWTFQGAIPVLLAIVGFRFTGGLTVNFSNAPFVGLIGLLFERSNGSASFSQSGTTNTQFFAGATLGLSTRFGFTAGEVALCAHWVPGWKHLAAGNVAVNVLGGTFQGVGVCYGVVQASGPAARISVGSWTQRGGQHGVSNGAHWVNTGTVAHPLLFACLDALNYLLFAVNGYVDLGTAVCVDTAKTYATLLAVVRADSTRFNAQTTCRFLARDGAAPNLGASSRVISVVYDCFLVVDGTNSTLHGAGGTGDVAVGVAAGGGSWTVVKALTEGTQLAANQRAAVRVL